MSNNHDHSVVAADQLRDAIDTLESGEQWQAWLDFGRQLHCYSFNNLILIFVQRPEAS